MTSRKHENHGLCSLLFSKYIFVFLLFFLLGFQSASLLHGLIHLDYTAKSYEISQKLLTRAKKMILSKNAPRYPVPNDTDFRSILDSLLHHLEDSNKSRSQNSTETPMGNLLPACQHEKAKIEPGDLEWKPMRNRYLVALCSRGQLSNRLICIRQSMLDAALLNRTLILPTKGLDFNFESLLDLNAISRCFGPRVFITLEDYEKTIKQKAKIDLLICHVHRYQTENICQQFTDKYGKALNITYERIHIPKRRTPSGWFKYPNNEFLKRFNTKHRVIAFVNMMGAGGRGIRIYDRKPFAVSNQCNGYLLPSKSIQEAAIGFIDTLLGNHFMAVHIRRGDFYRHCLKGDAKKRSLRCYRPMPQIAQCIVNKLREHRNVEVLYVATNADTVEFNILKTIITKKVEGIPIVRMATLKNKIWASSLNQQGLADSPVVLSLVEKTICAHSFVFFSNPGSTFSGDIHRIRSWWKGENISCDGYLCPQEQDADIFPLHSVKR